MAKKAVVVVLLTGRVGSWLKQQLLPEGHHVHYNLVQSAFSMDINGIKNKTIKQKAKSTAKASPSGISFATFLAGQVQEPIQTQQVNASSEIQNKSSSVSTRTTGIALTEKTIDFLAAYGDALDNLQLSKDDIRPLIEALEEGTTSLLDIKEQLDTDDPLAELLDRVAAVAYLESEKFRRGDYDT